MAQNGPCELTMSRRQSQTIGYTLVLGKGDPYTSTFNKQLGLLFSVSFVLYSYPFFSRIQYMWENGILPVIKSKYAPLEKIGRCLDRKVQRSNRRISLYDMSSSFVFLGIGVALSSLSFFVELVLKWYQRRSNHVSVLQVSPLESPDGKIRP